MPSPTIGVDVGGTKLLAVVLDGDREVVASHRVLTPRAGADTEDGAGGALLLDAVVDAVATLVADHHLDPGVSVGVGVAGLVGRDGVLCRGPNQPRVGRLDVAGGLQARLGRPVRVDNDANCALRAEVQSGAARGEREVVLVTLGTGIGGALLIDGTVVRGAHGLAGEPGHMLVDPAGPRCVCGRIGCWERYASGAGLARLAREAADAGRLDAMLAASGGRAGTIDGEAVVAAARAGDAAAQEVLDAFSWWTAVGLANLAALVDPAVVVLGGGLVDAADCWLDEVRRRFPELLVAAEDRPLPRVLTAAHGSAAAAVGAALLVT